MTGKNNGKNISLSGLRQSSLEFNKLLSGTRWDSGSSTAVDPCVFRLTSEDRRVEILLLCDVDDLMIACSVEKWKWLVEKINQSFKTNHLGTLSSYNGYGFVRNRKAGTMLMRHRACVDKLIQRYGVTTSCHNPSSLPNFVQAREEVTEEKLEGLFRYLVGGLSWIAPMIRPGVVTLFERWRAKLTTAHHAPERLRKRSSSIFRGLGMCAKISAANVVIN